MDWTALPIIQPQAPILPSSHQSLPYVYRQTLPQLTGQTHFYRSIAPAIIPFSPKTFIYPKRLDFRQGAKPMSHRSLYIINEDGEWVQATQHKLQSLRV